MLNVHILLKIHLVSEESLLSNSLQPFEIDSNVLVNLVIEFPIIVDFGECFELVKLLNYSEEKFANASVKFKHYNE